MFLYICCPDVLAQHFNLIEQNQKRIIQNQERTIRNEEWNYKRMKQTLLLESHGQPGASTIQFPSHTGPNIPPSCVVVTSTSTSPYCPSTLTSPAVLLGPNDPLLCSTVSVSSVEAQTPTAICPSPHVKVSTQEEMGTEVMDQIKFLAEKDSELWELLNDGVYQPPLPPLPNFSPTKTIESITAQFHDSRDAGRMAIQLALYHFFGEDMMARNTPGTLDPSKMQEIKNIVIKKFAMNSSPEDQETLWKKCKDAIGHRCNDIRRRRNAPRTRRPHGIG